MIVHQKLFCILGATIIFIEDYLVRAMVIIHSLCLSMSSYMTSCPLRYIVFIWSKYHWVPPGSEMIFGPPKNANDLLFPTKCWFFQYCYNNIELFSICYPFSYLSSSCSIAKVVTLNLFASFFGYWFCMLNGEIEK